MTRASDTALTGLVAGIVAAYVSNNSIPFTALPDLIRSVHSAIEKLISGTQQVEEIVEAPRAAPAVPIKNSITPEFIICLENGKKYQTLKRHLMASYNMTPDQYRAKWGLPGDYPMVATAFAAKRSMLAKHTGLGLQASGRPRKTTRS